MTTEPLLTISAFARAVELAPTTLRYYDEAGLLPPAEVDPRTGYRYYTPELERRAALIRRMREIGVPVESMRLVLAGTPEQASRILRSHAEAARHSARRAAEVVTDVLAALEPAQHDDDPVTVTVDGAEAAAALRRVARAASGEEEPLAGVLLDASGSTLTVVGTDRYWLAAWELPVAEAGVAQRRVFLPADQVAPLADRLERAEAATVSLSRTGLQLDDGAPAVPAGEDRFPAYRLVLPDTRTGRVLLDRTALQQLLVRHEAGPVRIAVADGAAEVGGYGDAPRSRVTAVTGGGPVTLWLSAELLDRALATLVGESLVLAWHAPDGAVEIGPAEQRRLRVLLMPVRPPA